MIIFFWRKIKQNKTKVVRGIVCIKYIELTMKKNKALLFKPEAYLKPNENNTREFKHIHYFPIWRTSLFHIIYSIFKCQAPNLNVIFTDALQLGQATPPLRS